MLFQNTNWPNILISLYFYAHNLFIIIDVRAKIEKISDIIAHSVSLIGIFRLSLHRIMQTRHN